MSAPALIRSRSLKRHLDRFLDGFARDRCVEMDPVRFVHRYDDATDREIVGFIAAAFAYGNVRSVLSTVEAIVSRMGPHPARFVAEFDPQRDRRAFRGFYHRWNNDRDLSVLLWILGRFLADHGSIESAMVGAGPNRGYDASEALDRFSGAALAYGHEQYYPRGDRERVGVRYFFPRPSGGSACKRMNLFLRWMVRPDDGVDCGVWQRVSPRDLVMPIDTHIARISRYIGLTERATPGWKMALDVTEALRLLDKDDPLRYDFALCHLGIAGDCPKKRDLVKCAHCPIQPVCLL